MDLNEEKKRAKVTVEESQAPLAIGKGGVNVNLAARLTGYEIDIVQLEVEKKEEPKVEEKAEESVPEVTAEEALESATAPETPAAEEATPSEPEEKQTEEVTKEDAK